MICLLRIHSQACSPCSKCVIVRFTSTRALDSRLSHLKEALSSPASVRFPWDLLPWLTHRLDKRKGGSGAFWMVRSSVLKKTFIIDNTEWIVYTTICQTTEQSSDTEFESGLVVHAKNIYYVPDTVLFPLLLWSLPFI